MERLRPFFGRSSGSGVNHERQPFRAEADVEEILQGRAVRIHVSARGGDGALHHEEETIIMRDPIFGKLNCWSFGIHVPLIVMAECEPEGLHAEGENLIQFSSGSLDNVEVHRQRITLKTAGAGKWSYAWEWGAPRGEFGPRSSVVLKIQE